MSLLPVGHELLSPTTSATAKIVKETFRGQPIRPNYFLIQPEGADIRWLDLIPGLQEGNLLEGSLVLSSTVGMRLGDGKILEYRGDWKNFTCIAVSGTPSVWVYKYVES